jgi:DNA polymerase III subunit epsilon
MTAGWWSRWRRQPEVDEDRWIVLDVETTGLDPDCDDLLCVAALAMHRHGNTWQLVPADSFEALVRPDVIQASPENVLLHGIGWGAQAQGRSPGLALRELQAWVGASPLVAFHADFDRAFLAQAFRREHLPPPPWRWLDLADLLPLAFEFEPRPRGLDDWMRRLQVHCVRRHQAAADVWATAQLWLMAVSRLETTSMAWSDWEAKAQQGRWLRRTSAHG